MKQLSASVLLMMSVVAIARPTPAEVAAWRDSALKDDLAWDITEGLTTEIGPRMAGTEAEERARTWAVAKLKALGFANVRIEYFDMPVWTRGIEQAEIVAPFPQKLVVTALGNSGATPVAGVTAEIVAFEGLQALQAAPPAAIKGKIVFVSHQMRATQDGSSYGVFGVIRRSGPEVAAAKGAVGFVMRSVGTDYHRNPHTGASGAGAAAIPSAALSLPDADQLFRMLKRGKPVSMKLVLTPKVTQGRSGNVIAEVPGSNPAAGIITVGGHLDSWDLGTGAIDDATGVAITTAAAKRIMEAGKPIRTIRVVWFGAEEVGLFGGRAYAQAHAKDKHAFLAESDLGAGRVWQYKTTVNAAALPALQSLEPALASLGIAKGSNGDAEGSDISVLAATGVPVIELSQDATRYFDLHHTPDDTLDKVDLGELRQNVAAWTVMLGILANDTTDLGPVPATKQ